MLQSKLMQVADISLQSPNGITLIPRVIGIQIPRRHNKSDYSVFMLAHFKPFSLLTPLLLKESLMSVYNHFSFDSDSIKLMNNWEAIYECEDARDADRVKKREKMLRETKVSSNDTIEDFKVDAVVMDNDHTKQQKSQKEALTFSCVQ